MGNRSFLVVKYQVVVVNLCKRELNLTSLFSLKSYLLEWPRHQSGLVRLVIGQVESLKFVMYHLAQRLPYQLIRRICISVKEK